MKRLLYQLSYHGLEASMKQRRRNSAEQNHCFDRFLSRIFGRSCYAAEESLVPAGAHARCGHIANACGQPAGAELSKLAIVFILAHGFHLLEHD